MSSLEDIDDAFLRLRRLWASSRQGILDDGVTSVELSSLLVVETCVRCEERDQEANVSHVAFLADVTPSTASRLVDTAERAGLLVRASSRHSARQTALQLTDAGRALRARAVAYRQGWLTDQLQHWNRRDVDRFAQLLQRFADQLHDRPHQPPTDQPSRSSASSPGPAQEPRERTAQADTLS